MNDATPIPREAIEAGGQSVRPRRRRALWTAVVLLLVAAAAAGIWWRTIPPAEREGPRKPPIPVLSATAATADVAVYLDALGTVQASSTVTVKAMVDGQLVAMNVAEGQDVRQGDVLARIDPRSYQATLDQAVAKKAQDEAQLANARADLVRYQKLAATAYTSAQTADTQKSTVAQLEAQVRQDQASIDSAATQLSFTTITAPIDGRAGLRQVDLGNIVHAGDTTGIVVITTLKPISVVFTLPQQTLGQVAAAMARGSAEVQALTQGSAAAPVLDRGRLAVLDNQVDPATGTIKLKASFPNADLTLWPGGFVAVKLRVDTLRGATTVPPAAIQRGPRGTYVYVIAADDTVARRLVRVGHEDEHASVIEDGLKPGEVVVTDGASRLTEASKVSIAAPPGAPSSDTPAAPARTRPARNRGAP